jgi:hypothetical protein
MDAHRNENVNSSVTVRPFPSQDSPCPNCEKQSCLQALIAELLHKNQSLRFEVLEERARVGRLERLVAGLRTG